MTIDVAILSLTPIIIFLVVVVIVICEHRENMAKIRTRQPAKPDPWVFKTETVTQRNQPVLNWCPEDKILSKTSRRAIRKHELRKKSKQDYQPPTYCY